MGFFFARDFAHFGWCVVLLKGRLWVRLVTILADGSRQGGEHEKKGTDKSLTCKQ